ncbi:MAG: hypothetical protein CSB06_01220 [Bacteroidia bacterium]|nr:MAG: hypothetical protein CSB06_01220 [Bacteroidia bacterium]
MKFYLKCILVVLFAHLSASQPTNHRPLPSFETTTLTYSEKKYIENYRFRQGYEEAIAFIKAHEGFAGGKIYKDASGLPTIGYGHRIKPGENFGKKISKQKAERILRADFDKALWHVEREIPPLTGYQKIAVAHFIYAKGIGNFRKSTFKKNILAGKPIEESLKRWCYYRKNCGQRVKSHYILKIRLWEIDMYNRA